MWSLVEYLAATSEDPNKVTLKRALFLWHKDERPPESLSPAPRKPPSAPLRASEGAERAKLRRQRFWSRLRGGWPLIDLSNPWSGAAGAALVVLGTKHPRSYRFLKYLAIGSKL